MPNWCMNALEIKGDAELIREWIIDTNFDFMKILPPPNDEWDYEWCSNNWGTKWSPDVRAMFDLDFEDWDGEDGISFGFDTAWCPPNGILEKLEEVGLYVKCYSLEEGCGYGYVWEGGETQDFDYRERLDSWIIENDYTADDLENCDDLDWHYFSDFEKDFFDQFDYLTDEMSQHYMDNYESENCAVCKKEVLEICLNTHSCAEGDYYCKTCFEKNEDRWDHKFECKPVFAELEEAKYNPRNPLGKLEVFRRAEEDGIVFEEEE